MNKWWTLIVNLLSIILPAVINTAKDTSDSKKEVE